jgi:hypothetical protein
VRLVVAVIGWFDFDEPPQPLHQLQLDGVVAVGEASADRRFGVGVFVVGQGVVADDVAAFGVGCRDEVA